MRTPKQPPAPPSSCQSGACGCGAPDDALSSIVTPIDKLLAAYAAKHPTAPGAAGAHTKQSGACCGGSGESEACCGGSSLPPQPQQAGLSRRKTLQGMGAALLAGLGAAVSGCSPATETAELARLNWSEYFKKNYRVMSDDEKTKTVERLVRKAQLRRQPTPSISTKGAVDGVLYGYAFNVSKCKGYMDCVQACVKENNQDRRSKMQYIRIFEVPKHKLNPEQGDGQIDHQVPAAGHVYMGTQCFQCENPPCVTVCPVGATWREPDGIVVIDYDWCIGCRYCQSACPYWARRFNWHTPTLPKNEINTKQHYLGNRPRQRGVMEKCTFCIQRTREGQLPACAEACPTGARVFGNLLDPKSEIRYVLEHKKVFRLKEDLGVEPKFWYFMD